MREGKGTKSGERKEEESTLSEFLYVVINYVFSLLKLCTGTKFLKVMAPR